MRRGQSWAGWRGGEDMHIQGIFGERYGHEAPESTAARAALAEAMTPDTTPASVVVAAAVEIET